MIHKYKHGLTILILIGLLVSSSCTAFELPEETGIILFQDDFSSPNSGWDRHHSETYSADYEDGAYKIQVHQNEHEAWALPGFNFSDIIIEVTAKKIEGPENNVFGILCRYQDPRNFYFFLISSDGYAGIGTYHDGRRELLSGDSMLPFESILQGSKSNDLKVHCVEDRLVLEANGSLLFEVHSDTLEAGDVGLIAGSYGNSAVSVLFDDFFVRNP
jgi:hypothetical protein